MRRFRRAVFALFIAACVAGVIRLRGKGGVPPQGGGWRELARGELVTPESAHTPPGQ
jgi:hypothetical protein